MVASLISQGFWVYPKPLTSYNNKLEEILHYGIMNVVTCVFFEREISKARKRTLEYPDSV